MLAQVILFLRIFVIFIILLSKRTGLCEKNRVNRYERPRKVIRKKIELRTKKKCLSCGTRLPGWSRSFSCPPSMQLQQMAVLHL